MAIRITKPDRDPVSGPTLVSPQVPPRPPANLVEGRMGSKADAIV